MKKQLFALLGLLLATASAYAQTGKLKADVPFNFAVAGRTLPSGEYTIQSETGVNHALSISGAGENPIIFLANWCGALKASEPTKLVFSRYGDQYFLSQVWMAGHDAGYQLRKSRREIEVARELARNHTAETVVVLAELP